MIVNYTAAGWQIITQRAHGLLAAQLCAYWKKDDQPARWVETLIATAEHDDVNNELENKDLINENGGPINFKDTDFDQEKCDKQLAMAETKSAYIALLVSRHTQFLHGAEPRAKEYIADLKKREKIWMKVAGISEEELCRGYELLEFCDAFSLLICQGLVQPEQRSIEISNGPDGTPYKMHAEKDKLIVEPWPFEVPSFKVSYELRTLAQLSFKTSEELRGLLADSMPVLQEMVIAEKV